MTSIDAAEPFALLTPDFVMDAVESLGFLCDARIFPLNSYENRVYQVGIDEAQPIIAKFYRPARWSSEQILEEHQFSAELAARDIPVVPPIIHADTSLFFYQDYPFALYPRRAGHAPELENLDQLYSLGQYLGRLHAMGAARPFVHRPTINVATFAVASREFLLSNNNLPKTLLADYEKMSSQLIEKLDKQFGSVKFANIRLHGDCHPGNILWRDGAPNIVDMDDARNGPAMQDLWMLLCGERHQQTQQMASMLEGYEEFHEFDRAQLRLIESLRSLRIMHYAAWLARRWRDPAFPKYFPWFGTDHYWQQHIFELREQLSRLDEPPISLQYY